MALEERSGGRRGENTSFCKDFHVFRSPLIYINTAMGMCVYIISALIIIIIIITIIIIKQQPSKEVR